MDESLENNFNFELNKEFEFVHFSFYTKEEIKNISVIEITNTMALDQFNNPIDNGLYDSKMGISPYNRGSLCSFCGLDDKECPGHLGHISLFLPIYNMLVMNLLHKILKSKCYFCNKFKISKKSLKEFEIMFLLLRLDFNNEYKLYKEMVKYKHDIVDNKKNLKFIDIMNEQNLNTKKKMKDIESILEPNNLKNLKNHVIKDTSSNQEVFQNLLKDFFKFNQSLEKCLNCKASQPTIKKDGFSKFKANFDKMSSKNTIDKNLKGVKIINPLDVKTQIEDLFKNNKTIINLILGKIIFSSSTQKLNKKGFNIIKPDPSMFFIEMLPVTPNRFRPENKLLDKTFLHSHTLILSKILDYNEFLKNEIKKLKINNNKINFNNSKDSNIKNIFSKWIELQENVNCLFDANQNVKNIDKEWGIKQLLEKKEGLFRMKMMGKRVNFSARSVISPDPNLNTNEVGVPLFVAKKLTFPENVFRYNFDYLKFLILNGPNKYPGAVAIIDVDKNKRYNLEGSTIDQRKVFIKSLLNGRKIVLRHLASGDILLFNRQPTLHKPSLTSHIARVLPKENTIRMHYANCSGYNADFDGDEMNLHLLQNHIARAEGYKLCLNDKQYILPTNKNPIRGLIQDYIFSSVFLTLKDKLFDRSEFTQLLYCSISNIILKDNVISKIPIIKPCILKPNVYWSGKQLISNLLKIISFQYEYGSNEKNKSEKGLYMTSKARLHEKYLSDCDKEESKVIIMDNEIITGIIDKNQIGASSFGLIHCFYEIYGSEKTGTLVTCLSRLLKSYLEIKGFSSSIDDLLMNKDFEKYREKNLEELHKFSVNEQKKQLNSKKDYLENHRLYNRPKYDKSGKESVNEYIKTKEYKTGDLPSLIKKKILNQVSGTEEIDNIVKLSLVKIQNEIKMLGMNNGLKNKFPKNKFSSIVLTGAKGSVLNHNQISCMLGQQELEGKRVPILPSGKSLPSFEAYSPNPRCGGFIGDRFLTGLRPQEFYFHCMAGREGLIDTAVKTSRSGYLQRILVKNLESLIVQYDYTVRDTSDQSIIQFYYGEDSLDGTKVNPLDKINFLNDNFLSFLEKMNINEMKKCLNSKEVKKFKNTSKEWSNQTETLMNQFSPAKYLGSISEKMRNNLENFIEKNIEKENKDYFEKLFYYQYFNTLINPGESVGAVAAQGFGEPSTQMTLNTFHLAGHGGANVTLGIPRLKEILTTKGTKIPIMILYFNEDLSKDEATKALLSMKKLSLLELINNIEIIENKLLINNGKILSKEDRCKKYEIILNFENLKAINDSFNLNIEDIKNEIKNNFLPKLMQNIKKKLKLNSEKIFNLEKDINQLKIKKHDSKKVNKNKVKKNINLSEDDNEINDLIDDSITVSNDDKTIELDNQNNNNSNSNNKPKKDNKKKDQLKESINNFKQNLNFDENSCEIILNIPLNSEKLLLLEMVEKLLENIFIKKIEGINCTYLLKKEENNKKIRYLQTEGANFYSIWKKSDLFNANKIECNDIHSIYNIYGIEAGRNSIIKEVKSVFEHYAIKVDYRHLSLVADYMSFPGYINPMNRTGLQYNTSALLKMSFETTVKFLIDACSSNNIDNLSTPSSNIVFGNLVKNGTGCFNIFDDEEKIENNLKKYF